MRNGSDKKNELILHFAFCILHFPFAEKAKGRKAAAARVVQPIVGRPFLPLYVESD